MPGYAFLHVNSLTNAGGVGIYISNNLRFQEFKLDIDSSLSGDIDSSLSGCEDIWVSITCPNTNIHYIIDSLVGLCVWWVCVDK